MDSLVINTISVPRGSARPRGAPLAGTAAGPTSADSSPARASTVVLEPSPRDPRRLFMHSPRTSVGAS